MSFKSALGRNTLKSNFGHGTEMEDLLEEEPVASNLEFNLKDF